MTFYRNSCQSVAAPGTDLSAIGGALPDPPSVVVPGTGGAITIETSGTAPGSKCFRVTPAAATQGYWGYTGMTGAGNAFAMRGLWKSPASLPGTFQPFVSLRSGGGGTGIATLAITATGVLQAIADVAGTSAVSSGALSTSTWYDIEIRLENPTTTTGVMSVVVRDLSGTVITSLGVVHGGVLGAGTANFGTTTIGGARLGKVATSGTLGATDWKYWTLQTGSSAALAQPGANTAPAVPAIASKIQGAGTTSFTASPTDSDGTIVTRAWTVTKPDGTSLTTGITGASTDTVTIANQGTAGSYKVDYTATDDFGASTSVTTWLLVPQASGVGASPYRVISNGGSWGPGGTATDVIDGLRSTSAAKYALSQDAPSGGTLIVALEVPAAGHYTYQTIVAWMEDDGATLKAGVVGPIKAQVMQGLTDITAEMIITQTAAGWYTFTYSFTTIEDAALTTDRTDIRLEISASVT